MCHCKDELKYIYKKCLFIKWVVMCTKAIRKCLIQSANDSLPWFMLLSDILQLNLQL